MNAVQDDVTAWRNAPWGGATGDQDWNFLGEDLSGATWRMEVRWTDGDTGTPLVSLANAAAGSEGFSATYDAGMVDPDTGEVFGGTRLRPQIAKATLQAITANSDPSQPQVLEYDVHCTPTCGVEQVRIFGTFTLQPGVTI